MTLTPTRTGLALKKLLLILALLLIVLIAIAVFAIPPIAGAVGKGIVERSVSDSIQGRVELDSLSVSWLGSQRADGFTLIGVDGQPIATGTATIGAGLIPLALGSRDLGEIVLELEATITELPEGGTDLQQAIAPAQPNAQPSQSGTGSAELPSGLAASVTITADRLLFVPIEGEPVGLTGVRGLAQLRAGQDASIQLDATTVRGGAGGSTPTADGGTIDLDGTISNWSQSNGTLTLDAAALDLTLAATQLPVDAIDGLAGLAGRLERALGDRLSLNATADGTLAAGTANIGLTSTSDVRGDVAITIADGVATASGPIELAAPIERLVAADEAIADRLTGSDARVRLDPAGVLMLRVTDLRVPTDLAAFDQAVATIELAPTEPIAGELIEQDGSRSSFSARDIMLTARLRDGVATLTGDAMAMVRGTSGGTLELAASTGSLVGPDGGFAAPAADTLAGRLTITGLDTALVDPLLAGVSDGGLTAEGSIGPRLDLELAVQPAGADGTRAATIMARSARFNADGALALSNEAIRTTEPITIRATDQRTGREGSLRITAVAGALDQDAPTIDATLESQAFPTAWLNPIASAFQDGDLQLVQHVGPTLDGTITASIDGDDATADPIRVSLEAQHLAADAELEMTAERVRLVSGTTATVRAARASGLAASFAPDGIALAGQGGVELTLQQLELPLAGGDPLGTGSARGTIRATNWSASIDEAGTVTLPSLDLNVALADRQASIAGGGEITSDGTRGTIDLSLETGIPTDTASIAAWRAERPIGSVTLSGLPLALAERLGVPSGLEGVTLRELAGGPTADVTLTLAPNGNAVSDPMRFEAGLSTRAINSTLAASLREDSLRIETLTTTVDASLAMLRSITNAAMPESELAPRLQTPGRIELMVEPVEIPLTDDYAIDTVSLAGQTARAELFISGDFKSFNMTAPDEAGETVETFRSGPIVLERLAITANAPLASVLADGTQPIEVEIAGPIRNRAGLLITELDADADITLAPTTIAANVAAGTISTDWVQSRLDTPQLASLLGPAPTVTAGIELAEGDAGVEPRSASLAIAGERFMTTEPLRVRFTPAAIELASPMRASWSPQPADLEALLGEGVRFADAINARLEVTELTLPTGDAPPTVVARVDTTPMVILDASDTPQRIGTLAATVRNRAGDASVIDFDAAIAQAAGTPIVSLDGQLNGLGGDGTPRVTATTTVTNAPTVLIDALAMQDGLLRDVLGDTINASIDLANVPADGGTIDATMRSSFATMSLDGVFQDQRFTITQQSGAELTAFSTGLNSRLSSALPLVGGITKTNEDGPAFLRLNALSYPLDGDLSKLNANVTLDIGDATVTASQLFGPVLGLANWRTTAGVGNRFEPITVQIENGVARYDTLKIPLGEFVVETTGSIDLGKRQQDLVFYVPFGALSQEFASSMQSDFASQLSSIPGLNLTDAKLPFVVSGSLDDNNQPQLDMQMFVEQTVGDALQPENLLRGILKEGLNRGQRRDDGG